MPTMQFDDRTEIRHRKIQKRLWMAAALRVEKELSEWIRETLDLAATADLPNRK